MEDNKKPPKKDVGQYVNAFDIPVPVEGEEIVLQFVSVSKPTGPEESHVKARHPSGCWVFPDRKSRFIPEPGQIVRCRITKHIGDEKKGCAFADVFEVFGQRPRPSRLHAQAFTRGAEIMIREKNTLYETTSENHEESRQEVEELRENLRETEARFNTIQEEKEVLEADLASLEEMKAEYEPFLVSDEVKQDEDLTAEPESVW